jgi:hypothetical protein
VSLLQYQDALARLLTDRSFREAFVSNPADACARYALDRRELRSLSDVHIQPMSQHADLLGQGRVMLAFKALPHAARLLGGDVVRTVEPFCAACPPVPVGAPGVVVEARRYAAFLRSNVTKLGLAARIGEVAAYEAALYEHSNDVGAWAAAKAFAAENAAAWSDSADTFATKVPVTGKHARIEMFAHDVPAIIDALGHSRPVEPETHARPTIVLFIKGATRRTSEALRITRDIGALLAECNGSATGHEIAGRMSVEAQRRGLPDERMLNHLFTLCEALRRKNVLTYRELTRARIQ